MTRPSEGDVVSKSQKRRLGPGQVAQLAQDQRLVEEQLVVGSLRTPRAACLESLVRLLQLPQARHDHGMKLGDDRIAGSRPFQAPPQQWQCIGRPVRLAVERTQVEEDERLVRSLFVLDQEKPQVALELATAQGEILVPRMLDHDIAAPQINPRSSQRGQDLLVNPVIPLDLGKPAEEPNLVHDDRRLRSWPRCRALPHEKRGILIFQPAQ